MKDMNVGLDVMARSGQAIGKSFSELTAATTAYMYATNKAAISGALMGHSGEESKKAFELLSQTFGGTTDVVEDVSNNFGDLATIAKFSGMSIGDAAAYADQNWKRLGKTMKESSADIATMGLNTSHLNSMFGQGKVDTMEYAQTVSDLSFQSGNYNQNTKFLIESLNRELAIQLSLGKSRDAAMASAKRNLEKAGKANVLGAKILGRKLQAEYDLGKIGVDEAKERFGSEWELMMKLLEEGVESGDNLFALAELMKGSSEMSGELLNEVRKDAARGGSLALATGQATTVPEMALMKLQERAREAEFQAVKEAKGPEELEAALANIFREFKEEAADPAAQARIKSWGEAMQADPDMDARAGFNEVIKDIMPDGDTDDTINEFMAQVGTGANLAKAIGVVIELPKVLLSMPVLIAAAIAGEGAVEGAMKIGGLLWEDLKESWRQASDSEELSTRRGGTYGGMKPEDEREFRQEIGAEWDEMGGHAGTGQGRRAYQDTKWKLELKKRERAASSEAENVEMARSLGIYPPLTDEDVSVLLENDVDPEAVMASAQEEGATPAATKPGAKPPAASKKAASASGVGRELEGQFDTDGNDVIVRIPGGKEDFKNLAGEADLERSEIVTAQ
jgi:hypothetical protein